MKRRVLAMLMCIVMIVGILPMSALAAAASDNVEAAPLKSVTATHINPLYEDIIDETDLVQPGIALLADDVEYYSTIEEAGAAMREQMEARQTTVTVGLCVEDYDPSTIINEVSDAAMVHTGVPTEGDYIAWQYGGWNANAGGYVADNEYYLTLTYTVTYYTTAEQEAAVDTAVEELLAELELDDASDYEKVESVYNWICENVAYDHENLEDEGYDLKYTAYAALIDKTSVCQGYAVLLYRMLLELGVDNRVVAGVSFDENHSWNIVELDGLYYNLDSTWDAGVFEYSYFLKGSDTFEDHERWGEYTTEEFNAAYPMSAEDYSTETEIPESGITGECGDDLTWTLDENGTLTISGEGDMYDYDYYGTPWIDYNDSILSIVIEEGVTSIGGNAFDSCYVVENVSIANTVTSIGSGAFQECFGLTEISIPASVTDIRNAFNYCHAMTAIWVDEDNQYYSSDENGILYNEDKTELVKVPCGYTGEFNVPAGVTAISDSSFVGCETVTGITIPASVTYVSEFAFNNCDILEEIVVDENNQNYSSDEMGVLFDKDKTELIKVPASVTGSYVIPDGVTTVYYEAVMGCEEITSITIPASVSNIQNIKGCGSLVEIIVDEENPNYSSENGILYNKDKSELISVPDGITGMLEIPANVTSIENGAFLYCIGLNVIRFKGNAPSIDTIYGIYWPMAVYYPENDPTWTEEVMQSFGEEITWNAYDATDPDAPLPGISGECGENLTWTLTVDGVLTISGEGDMYDYWEYYPGWNGNYIDTVIIEDGVTSIGGWAFQECSIASISIPDSVTSIGDGAFFSSYGLTEIRIPASVEYIGSNAFRYCYDMGAIWVDEENEYFSSDENGVLFNKDKTGLIKVPTTYEGVYAVPEGVEFIDGDAFASCGMITSIIIPASVNDIHPSAFDSCESLEEIVVDEDNEYYSSDERGVLFDKDKIVLIKAPCMTAGEYTIPDSVEYINSDAFFECWGLESVYVPASVIEIGACAFNSCYNLYEIIVSEDNEHYSSDEYGVLYNKDMSELVYVPGGIYEMYTVPASVTSIEYGAFFDSTSLSVIRFAGDAPSFDEEDMLWWAPMVYYPENNDTWTEDVMMSLGAEAVWVPYDATDLDAPLPDITGVCGENLTWTLTPDGLLTISGEGDMWNFEEGESPWNDYYESVFSVVIEEGVTSIGDRAFCKQFFVNSVEIADTVTSIGEHAFFGCFEMTSIEIPASVTEIGWRAFVDCDSLEAIWVDEDNEFFSNDEYGVLFNKDKTELIRIPDALYGEYHIPESVTMFNETAVEYVDNLITLHIPAGVSEIYGWTFSGCYSLEEVIFEGDAPTFYDYSFSGAALTVYYPENNPTWTEDVMQSYEGEIEWVGYGSEESDIIASGVCGENLTWQLTDYGTLIISGEGAMYKYADHYDVPWIGYSDEITTVVIEDGATTVCDAAFAMCYSLTDVTLPDSLTSIGWRAFYYCSSLTSIRIPAGITDIGVEAFLFCSDLEEITVDEDNQRYSSDEVGVLYDDINNVLVQAPPMGIYGEYTVPEGVETIGYYAFCFCEKMTEVTLPVSLTTIEEGAFSACYKLTSITIPEGVTSIDGYAFLACEALDEIVFEGDAPEFNKDAFNDITATVYYPVNNETWTEDVMQSYEGEIEWIGYGSDVERPLGDVNGDGQLTNADVITVARYLVKLLVKNPEAEAEVEQYGDINGDGKVSNTDLVLMVRTIVEL